MGDTHECIGTVSGSQEHWSSLLGRGRVTILPDQVDNFGQDGIIVWIPELVQVHRFRKAANLGVDTRLGTGTGKVVHDRLNTSR